MASNGEREHEERVPRFSAGTRIVHWTIALWFVLALLSGFALFEPAFYWLSAIFGGGSWMRILHPYLGSLLALLFFVYASGIWRDNLLFKSDYEWLRRAPQIMNRTAELPVEGKYNAGQKLLFWLSGAVIVLLLLTGVPLWRPWFAPIFPAQLRRVFVILH